MPRLSLVDEIVRLFENSATNDLHTLPSVLFEHPPSIDPSGRTMI